MTAQLREILRRKQLEQRLNIGCSAIYAKLKFNPKRPGDYDPTFPKPIPLGERAVGWLAHEVDAWLDAQAAKRNASANPEPAPIPQPRRTARKQGGAV